MGLARCFPLLLRLCLFLGAVNVSSVEMRKVENVAGILNASANAIAHDIILIAGVCRLDSNNPLLASNLNLAASNLILATFPHFLLTILCKFYKD